jgi:hypothetical protein
MAEEYRSLLAPGQTVWVVSCVCLAAEPNLPPAVPLYFRLPMQALVAKVVKLACQQVKQPMATPVASTSARLMQKMVMAAQLNYMWEPEIRELVEVSKSPLARRRLHQEAILHYVVGRVQSHRVAPLALHPPTLAPQVSVEIYRCTLVQLLVVALVLLQSKLEILQAKRALLNLLLVRVLADAAET